MIKRFGLLALCFGLLATPIVGCSDDDDNTPDFEQLEKELSVKLTKSAKPYAVAQVAAESLENFVKGQYDLNFELLKASDEQIKDNNAMISTYSIQSALGMTWAGAAGDTAEEMKKALHFDGNPHQSLNKITSLVKKETDSKVVLGINNNIYISNKKYTWKDTWLDVLSVNYDNGVTEIDFAADPEGARTYINGIVSRDTHNKINELLPKNSINTQTHLVLTNAIYLKAPWRDEMEDVTSVKTFKSLKDGEVSANYFGTTHVYAYKSAEKYQAVSVPLRGDHYHMLFVLPNDGAYNDVVSSLNGDVMIDVLKSMEWKHVDLAVPEYEFETELDLVDSLKSLGMKKAFSEEADFSGLTNEPNQLSIGAVAHKTYILVNKEGAEAAAATGVVVGNGAEPEPEDLITFTLDRPFVYAIYEYDSMSPLFVGRVLNPAAK